MIRKNEKLLDFTLKNARRKIFLENCVVTHGCVESKTCHFEWGDVDDWLEGVRGAGQFVVERPLLRPMKARGASTIHKLFVFLWPSLILPAIMGKPFGVKWQKSHHEAFGNHPLS